MRAGAISAAPTALRLGHSKRLLALAGDERLVEHVRAGNEGAFEVAFERHGPSILGFCRHMLGSPHEAEDAVQQVFASAHRKLLEDDRPVRLKPWLFTIARNRCLSMLRARREPAAELDDVPTEGLSDQVERRSDLRDLLADVRDLPDEQRASLLLAELGDLSHGEVAGVLGCEVNRVKALVFRARSGLIERRDARAAPCEEIREQLANLRGGSLRRSELRHHLRVCAGCRDYREQVKRQRRQLAAALPVTPSLGLKSSVLGLGGGAGGGALGGGLGAGLAASAPLGATVAKVATAVALTAGGVAVGERALDHPAPPARATHAIPAIPAPTRQANPAAPAVTAAPRQGRAATPAPSRHSDADAPTRSSTSSSVAPQSASGAPGHGHGHAYGHAKAPGQPAAPKPGGPPGHSRGKGATKHSATAPAAPPKPAKQKQAGPKPKQNGAAAKQKSAPPVKAPKAPKPAKVKLPNGVARGQK